MKDGCQYGVNLQPTAPVVKDLLGVLALAGNSVEAFQPPRPSPSLLVYQASLVNMCHFNIGALLLYCCYKTLSPHILIRCRIACFVFPILDQKHPILNLNKMLWKFLRRIIIWLKKIGNNHSVCQHLKKQTKTKQKINSKTTESGKYKWTFDSLVQNWEA